MIKDTYKELENKLTMTHLFYFQEHNNTKWDTKKACRRIFNNTATALQKARRLEKDWNYLKAIEILLKSFDRVEKIKTDFILTY